MHQLQKTLLKRLLLKNHQRYATLAFGYDYDDNVIFHINKLIVNEYIQKQNKVYSITTKGIKAIAQFENYDSEDLGIKSFFVGFKIKDSNNNFLLKSHPNARENFINLPSGRAFFGEKIEVALERIFQKFSRISISSDRFKYISLHLKTIQTKNSEVLFDDAFGIYEVELNDTQKKAVKLADNYKWYSQEQIKKLKNKWPEVDRVILEGKVQKYCAYVYTTDYIL